MVLEVVLAAALATPSPTPLPRGSDLWSAVSAVPGVVLDRVNVGGSESALQPIVVWRGESGATTWTLDGLDLTDPAAPGSSALYLHPFLLGSIAVSEAGDVRGRTPGLALQLRTEPPPPGRGHGQLFVRSTGAALQSGNVDSDVDARSLVNNETRAATEAGARGSGRFAGGRLGATLGATWSRLRQRAFTEHDERHRLTSILARADAEMGAATRAALAFVRTEKVHDERDTTFTAEPEARWRQSGPAYVLAVQAQRVVTPHLVLRADAGALDSTFRLRPPGGPDADAFEDFRGVFRGSYLHLDSTRRRRQIRVEAIGQVRRGGSAFDLRAGIGHRAMPVSTRSGWPGNKVIASVREQVFFRTFRLTGFAQPTRDQDVRSTHTHSEAYASATLRRGRLRIHAGGRLDRLTGRNEAVAIAANPLFPALLPSMTFDGSPARFRWLDLLPRAGIEWRPATAQWSAAVRYATFTGALGSGDVAFDHPGRDLASLSYYWRDRNGDLAVQPDELEVARGRLGAAGVDPDHPDAPQSPHVIDPALRAPRTDEWSGAFDATHRAARLGLVAYYRRARAPLWRPLQGLTRADYAIRGAASGRLFDEDYSVGYYAPASASKIAPGNGRILTNREGYHQDVLGLELTLAGTGGAVQWAAWGAVNDWRERFDDVDRAVQDPTPTDSEPVRHGGAVAIRGGGFGRADVFVNARWSAGAWARAPRVAGFEASVRLSARDGFPVPYVQVASTGDPTAGGKAVLVSRALDRHRLPALFETDVRLERGWDWKSGRLTATADVFNALNRATALQVGRDVELSGVGKPREILRPRIVRLGLTLAF
jgi:hypothetical protein